MATVQSLVDEKIKGKKVMVFSKSYCPYCTKAKDVLKTLVDSGSLSVEDLEILEMDGDPSMDAMQDYLLKLTGARSVPRVFIKGKFVGGGDEMISLSQSGELVKLLD